MSEIKISIIIPTIGRTRELFALFASIKKQIFAADMYEVIVVSELFLPKIQMLLNEFQFANSSYMQAGVRGVNHSRNLGIEISKGEILYFLDDDCELINLHQFQEINDILSYSENIVGVGGSYILHDKASAFERAYHQTAATWYKVHLLFGVYTSRLFGGNAAYQKKAIGSLRFDSRIKFGGAEEEFNSKIIKQGSKLLANEALAVKHNVKVSPLEFFKKAALQGYWHGERRDRIQTIAIDKDEFVRNEPNTSAAVAILIFIYRYVFRFAADLKGEKSFFKNAVQIFLVTPICIFDEKIQPRERLTCFLNECRYRLEKFGRALYWKFIWPGSYPFRKLYYFISYQVRHRLKNVVSKNES